MCEGKDGHSRFSPASSINILTKSALGEKVSFAPSSKLQLIMVRKSNQELKSQSSTQEQRETNVLKSLLLTASSFLLYYVVQQPLPREWYIP